MAHVSLPYINTGRVIVLYNRTSWNTRRCPGGIQDEGKEIEWLHALSLYSIDEYLSINREWSKIRLY
jgi:hypothetical protein